MSLFVDIMIVVVWLMAGAVFVYYHRRATKRMERHESEIHHYQESSVGLPMMFSELLMHSEMEAKHKSTSAGFCELAANRRWLVHGYSTSLKLNARPEDAAILNAYLL